MPPPPKHNPRYRPFKSQVALTAPGSIFCCVLKVKSSADGSKGLRQPQKGCSQLLLSNSQTAESAATDEPARLARCNVVTFKLYLHWFAYNQTTQLCQFNTHRQRQSRVHIHTKPPHFFQPSLTTTKLCHSKHGRLDCDI